MSHPFGDQIAQHLYRKHGLSQAKLAEGILQDLSIISEMSQGKRLNGPQAHERVTTIIGWLQQQGTLTNLDEANSRRLSVVRDRLAQLHCASLSPCRRATLISQASWSMFTRRPRHHPD